MNSKLNKFVLLYSVVVLFIYPLCLLYLSIFTTKYMKEYNYNLDVILYKTITLSCHIVILVCKRRKLVYSRVCVK